MRQWKARERGRIRGKKRTSRSEPSGDERSSVDSSAILALSSSVSWGWQFIFYPSSSKQGTKHMFYGASVRSKMIDRLKPSVQKVTCWFVANKQEMF